MCVIGWSFRGVHGGVFMVCEMVVAVLFCLSRWCVYSLLGSTSPVVHVGCMSLRVCGLSACSSGVRVVSVCCVRVLRFVRVFVSLLVEQGRDESSLSW